MTTRITAEAQGRWELAKLDTEELPDVAATYGIVSIPNVKLFVNGEIVDEFVGLMPERALPGSARTIGRTRERTRFMR